MARTIAAAVVLLLPTTGSAQQEWTIQFSASLPDVAAGRTYANGVTAQVRNGASDTFDSYTLDVPEPPAPPTGLRFASVPVGFAPPLGVDSFDVETKSAAFTNGQRKTWQLRLASYGASGTCTVSWALTSFPGDYVAALTDQTGGNVRYDLRTQTSFSFSLSSGGARDLLLEVTRLSPIQSISGRVTLGGAGVANVTLTAQPGGKTATTDGSGNYSIVALTPGAYTVSASSTNPEHQFSPASRSATVTDQNATGVDFTCTLRTYAISGTIVDERGAAWEGIRVTALPGGATTTTSASGFYSFSGLTANTYRLTPSDPEATFDYAYHDVTVNVATGSVANADFRATRGKYPISGRVITGTGTALAGAIITALRNGGPPGSSATSAADGTYTIGGLVAGTYTLTLAHDEAASVDPPSRTASVNASSPEATREDFICTMKTYDIIGVVKDEAGSALSKAALTLNPGGATTTTSGDGSYASRRVLAGTYTVTPSHPEVPTFIPASQSVMVNFSVGSKSGVDFTGTIKTYSISGAVKDEGTGTPIAGATVTTTGAAAMTDAEGKYTVGRLRAGTYSLTATKEEWTLTAQFTQPVTVGPSTTGRDFAGTQWTYSISGRVKDGSGNGIAGVTVNGGGKSVTTNANGDYAIDGLVKGTYTLLAGKTDWSIEPQFAQPVAVGPDAQGKDFVGTQTPVYSISGTVKDTAGVPEAGVVVSTAGKSYTTGSDGVYVLSPLVAGSYTVTASKSEWTFTAQFPQPVVVGNGVNATGKDFEGPRPRYSISGRVRDEGGNPVSGATVTAGGKAFTTGAEGSYTLTDLVAGTYTVTASHDEYTSVTGSLTVTLGPPAGRKDFVLRRKLYSISGTITTSCERALAGIEVRCGDRSTRSSEDGTYLFEGLTNGTSSVNPAQAREPFNPASQQVTVNNAAGSATGIDFVMQDSVAPMVQVQSLATGRKFPISQGVPFVFCWSYTETCPASVEVRFQKEVAPGRVEYRTALSLSRDKLKPGADQRCDNLTLGCDIPSVPPGYPVDLRLVMVDEAGRQTEVTITDALSIANTYSISGTIVDGCGNPMPGVTVKCGKASTATDANGQYTLQGIGAGAVTVQPQATGYTFKPASTKLTLGCKGHLFGATDINFSAVDKLKSTVAIVSPTRRAPASVPPGGSFEVQWTYTEACPKAARVYWKAGWKKTLLTELPQSELPPGTNSKVTPVTAPGSAKAGTTADLQVEVEDMAGNKGTATSPACVKVVKTSTAASAEATGVRAPRLTLVSVQRVGARVMAAFTLNQAAVVRVRAFSPRGTCLFAARSPVLPAGMRQFTWQPGVRGLALSRAGCVVELTVLDLEGRRLDVVRRKLGPQR